jgi:hypothetical protein
MKLQRYSIYGFSSPQETNHDDGNWCTAIDVTKLEKRLEEAESLNAELIEDVTKLEKRLKEAESLNAELIEFVENFWQAKQKGREDEDWLADDAWDLMTRQDLRTY